MSGGLVDATSTLVPDSSRSDPAHAVGTPPNSRGRTGSLDDDTRNTSDEQTQNVHDQSPQAQLPPNAYAQRNAYSQHELEEQKAAALRTWNNRVRICFGLQLLSAGCLLHSYYWFTTVIGFVMVIASFLYAHIVRQQKHEFALAYLLLVSMNWIKNVVVVYQYVTASSMLGYEYFLVILLIIDCAFLAPSTLYCCWYLYRSHSLIALSY